MEVFGRRAVGFGVQHEVDPALAEQRHLLGAVAAGQAEADGVEEGGQPGAGLLVDGEFKELETVENGRLWQDGCARVGLDEDQGAQAVAGGKLAWGGAELVVEYLERQGAAVAAGQDGAHEAGDVERALAGEEPVVAGPAQHVHGQARGVGELDEEQFFGGHLRDGGKIVVQSEGVEAVDDQAKGWVVGHLDDAPGMGPAGDVAAPGQRLEPYAQAAAGGTFGHGVQVCGGARVIADRRGLDVAAYQHQVGAELLHYVELAFRAIQIAGAQGLGGGFEVAEGLEDTDAEAEAHRDVADVGRAAFVGQQVGLEDLDGVETDGCGRLQLLLEGAAETDGGDGTGQVAALPRQGVAHPCSRIA